MSKRTNAELEQALAEKEAENEVLRGRIALMEKGGGLYDVRNVKTVSEWAKEYADGISNSAVNMLIHKKKIDAVKIGGSKQHAIILTPKTLEYKRGYQGPRKESKREQELVATGKSRIVKTTSKEA